MRFRIASIVSALLLATVAQAADRAEPKDDKDRVSYAIGLDVARNFKKNSVEFDAAWVMKGLQDGLSGERPLLKEKEFRKLLSDFQNQLRQRMAANLRVLAVDNRKRADAFLQDNERREGVQSLGRGLQYQVVREGQGPRAGDLDAVRLNYRGTLLDGNEFDGTDTGKPGTLKVLQAFNGLREVLKAMPAGSHWKVWIAPQLAYGERGVGSDIGPNELLCYDIELLAVLPGEGR